MITITKKIPTFTVTEWSSSCMTGSWCSCPLIVCYPFCKFFDSAFNWTSCIDYYLTNFIRFCRLLSCFQNHNRRELLVRQQEARLASSNHPVLCVVGIVWIKMFFRSTAFLFQSASSFVLYLWALSVFLKRGKYLFVSLSRDHKNSLL